jgi:5'-3' exonuclease
MNVVVDGNYLFHRSLSIFSSYEGVVDPILSLEEDKYYNMFKRKIALDLCSILSNIKDIERAIVVFDRTSWRKTFYPEYKGNRGEKDDSWSHFYRLMDEYEVILKNKGFIVSRLNELEGDDLLFAWSRYFITAGEKCIIVTADRDAAQLATDTVFVYSPDTKNSKLYVVDDKRVDFFNYKANYNIVKIDPALLILEKVLSGDKGDNVPNIYKGLGEKSIEKIIEKIKNKYSTVEDLFSSDFYYTLLDVLFESKKDLDKNVLDKRLSENIKLVVLHHNVYDESLINRMLGHMLLVVDNYTFSGEFEMVSVLNLEKQIK